MLYNIIKYVKVQTVTVFVSRLCLCFSFSQVGPVKFSVWYNLEWQRLDVLNIYLLFFFAPLVNDCSRTVTGNCDDKYTKVQHLTTLNSCLFSPLKQKREYIVHETITSTFFKET